MSDELERLRAQVEAQAAALRAVRELAERWQDSWSETRRPTEWDRGTRVVADQVIGILDGTATP